MSDGATLLRLSLARGPGGKSLQDTAVWAHLNGLASLTGQSLNERLHRSVAFLAGIIHRLLAGRSTGRPLLWAGRCLRIADGSSLSQPGSTGTDWRLHGVYDLGRGGFSHLELTDRHGAELLLRCEPVAGEVLIADRGYARAKELRALSRSVGRRFAGLHRAGRLESAGAARCRGQSVQSDRPSGDVAGPMPGHRNGRCRRWSAAASKPACCRSG